MTRRSALLAPVLAGALVLAGCGGAAPELEADAAEDLQAAVVELAEASAQGRWDAAEEGVARVRSLLEEAAADGDISVARYATVIAALERTEDELAAAKETDAAAAAAVAPTGDEAAEAPTADEPATPTEDATRGDAGVEKDEKPAGPAGKDGKPGKGRPGPADPPGKGKGRG